MRSTSSGETKVTERRNAKSYRARRERAYFSGVLAGGFTPVDVAIVLDETRAMAAREAHEVAEWQESRS